MCVCVCVEQAKPPAPHAGARTHTDSLANPTASSSSYATALCSATDTRCAAYVNHLVADHEFTSHSPCTRAKAVSA